MIKLNDIISLLEGKTIFGRFSTDWTKSSKRIKIPHRKLGCLDSDSKNNCSDCVIESRLICFNCEVERACETCLD